MTTNGDPVRAHLNGGPRDGEEAVLPPYRSVYICFDAQFPGIGAYRARRDTSGELVPYDLKSVEFDWVS